MYPNKKNRASEKKTPTHTTSICNTAQRFNFYFLIDSTTPSILKDKDTKSENINMPQNNFELFYNRGNHFFKKKLKDLIKEIFSILDSIILAKMLTKAW